MKIGILTQPLLNNYGGLLQNFALQKVLMELGHEVLTINIKYKNRSFIRKSASLLKRIFLKFTGTNIRVFNVIPSEYEANFISQNTSRFVREHINSTRFINQKINEKLLTVYKFEVFLVGSDQVWRPKYSPQLSTFFLDFLEGNSS